MVQIDRMTFHNSYVMEHWLVRVVAAYSRANMHRPSAVVVLSVVLA
jgi:hypothetical protein